MTPPLSLHQLVAPDAAPAQLAEIAAELGCAHVCLFTQAARGGLPFPVVAAKDAPALKRRMADLGVSAFAIAAFALAPDLDPAACEPALAAGASLGASRVSLRLLDPDLGRAAERFAAFAALARAHGLAASIEFVGWRRPQALAEALEVIRRAGEGALTLDALHVHRAGVLEAVRRLAPDEVGYVQLCDGPAEVASEAAYARESAFDRRPPGEGAFQLAPLLALSPPDRPICLEVPQEPRRLAGAPPKARARAVVEAARRLIAAVPPRP